MQNPFEKLGQRKPREEYDCTQCDNEAAFVYANTDGYALWTCEYGHQNRTKV